MIELLESSVDGDVAIESFPGFVVLDGPVWRKGQGALRPACYPQDSDQIALRAKIKAVALADSSAEIELQASASTFRFEGSGRISRGKTLEVQMPRVSGKFSSQVKVRSLALSWRFREDGGSWTDLVQTDAITIFQTYAAPLLTPYDLGLKKACGYVNGSGDPELALCRDIAAEICYDPTQSTSGHVLDLYASLRGDCNDHANLMEHLCHTLGIQARIVKVWGGSQQRRIRYRYQRDGEILTPTLQLDRPAHDEASYHPHFNSHALVESGSRILDPSYGKQVQHAALEVAPRASHQKSANLPMNSTDADWQCAHQ